MKFKDYSSIENHYNNKFVNGILVRHPEVIDMDFQLTEKLDGSNFQISITADEVKYGKRTDWLTPGERFFDWETVIRQDHIVSFVKSVQDSLTGTEDRFDIFGELFGPGVQKRIQYRAKKDIMFFEMRKNGEWVTPREFMSFLESHNAQNLHVPVVAIIKGLEAAIAFDTKIATLLFEPIPDSRVTEAQECEGLVIKPLDFVVYDRLNKVIFKKKNEAFFEMMKCSAGKDRIVKTLSPEQEEFLLYINENRMAGVVSKHGEPSEMKDIGKYLSILANDAFNDFCKDKEWDLSDISKTGRSAYTGLVGPIGLPLIKKYL